MLIKIFKLQYIYEQAYRNVKVSVLYENFFFKSEINTKQSFKKNRMSNNLEVRKT